MLRIVHLGVELPYEGPLYRRLPPTEADYVSLNAGQRNSVVVRIDDAYPINYAGSYQVAYKRRELGSASAGSNTIVSNTAIFEMNGDARRAKRAPRFHSCDANEQGQLNAALAAAESISAVASRDIRNTPASQRPNARRYREWFGAFHQSRWNVVQSTFDKIASAAANQVMDFNCTMCEQGTVAFVYPNRAYEINLCKSFWRFPTSGNNSKAGIIVHELSHFTIVGDTGDFAYGRTDSVNLANGEPLDAVFNADSYSFFAENSPPFPMPTGSDPPPVDPEDPSDPSDPMEPVIPEPPVPVIAPIIDLLLREDD